MLGEELDPVLVAWLDAVQEQWRRTGVPMLTRQALARSLEQDLRDAIGAGASVADLTATEPAEFADQLAAAHGHPPRPQEIRIPVTPGRLATTVLGGAVAGALAVWFVVWPLVFAHTATLGDGALVAIAYPIAGACVLLGSVIALRVRFGGRAFVRVALPAVAGLVVGALLGLPATLSISAALDYPTQATFVALEALPVVVLALGGAYVVSWIAPRARPADRVDSLTAWQ